jgi:hypothetical protein
LVAMAHPLGVTTCVRVGGRDARGGGGYSEAPGEPRPRFGSGDVLERERIEQMEHAVERVKGGPS